MTKLPVETPYERFKQTYVGLYRILLVLGALSVLSSLTSLTKLRVFANQLTTDPIYAISGFVIGIVVPAMMLASLILLWHKHHMGIRLRLGGYAVSIAAALLGFFTSRATLDAYANDFLTAAKNSGLTIAPESAQYTTQFVFYGALYLSIGLSLLFGWLWWKAWKKQMQSDARKKSRNKES